MLASGLRRGCCCGLHILCMEGCLSSSIWMKDPSFWQGIGQLCGLVAMYSALCLKEFLVPLLDFEAWGDLCDWPSFYSQSLPR